MNLFYLILFSGETATVFRIAGEEVTSFSAEAAEETTLAQAVTEILQEQEYNAQPVLLALRSRDVLSVPLPPDASANRQAMIYELEEYVPIPAEQFIADFVIHEKGRFAGVIDYQRLLPFLDELAVNQILVRSIIPFSFFVVQYFAKPGTRCLLWSGQPDSGRIEVFFLTSEGQPLAWLLPDANAESLKRIFETENQDIDLLVPYLSEEFRQVLTEMPNVHLIPNEPETEILLAVARQGAAFLLRKQKPWWDFCRDALAMRGTDRVFGAAIRRFLWGSIAFLTALCLVLGVRAFQYSRLDTQARTEQEKVFREALPEQKLQTGFRNRLESEYKKMSAQRENTGDLPERESVLIPLLNVLKSLPPKVRYRFPEIRFEPETIRLDGQLQIHGDAEVLATAMEKGGFAVEPPSTQQNAGGNSGVSVRLTILRKEGKQ